MAKAMIVCAIVALVKDVQYLEKRFQDRERYGMHDILRCGRVEVNIHPKAEGYKKKDKEPYAADD